MAIDKAVITADEQRLIDLVTHAERRDRRAREKLAVAQTEAQEAHHHMTAARARLDDWRDTHPGQSVLPL